MSYMMCCPHCGKHLKADLQQVGRKVGCNACRKPFVHPGADELIARVKFAEDPATASATASPRPAERAAETVPTKNRSVTVWVASLACVIVVAGSVFAFRNRGAADAGDGPLVVALGDSADLPPVEVVLADDRSYTLHLSGDSAGAGIKIDEAAGTAALNRKVYQLTGTFLEAAELRRLLEESQSAGRTPTSIVARDADGLPMLFLTKVYVAKPSLAGWLREVRDRSRLSPPFTIAAAVDSAGNIYLELTRDAADTSSVRSGLRDRD